MYNLVREIESTENRRKSDKIIRSESFKDQHVEILLGNAYKLQHTEYRLPADLCIYKYDSDTF